MADKKEFKQGSITRFVAFSKGSLRHSIYKSVLEFEESGKSFQEIVKLPPGKDETDWKNVHVRHFFNKIQEIYKYIWTDCYNGKHCKQMTINMCEPIQWIDHDTKKKKQTTAYQYVKEAFRLAECKIKDDVFFPENKDVPIPMDEFNKICQKIFTEYFRILGHIYMQHIIDLDKHGQRDSFNKCYAHLLAFIQEFNLVSPREYNCMEDVTIAVQQSNERNENSIPPVNDDCQ